MEDQNQRTYHQRYHLAGSYVFPLHHLSESQTLVSMVEKGDFITWLWKGVEYVGKVIGLLTDKIISVVTPDKKQWAVMLSEITEWQQHDNVQHKG